MKMLVGGSVRSPGLLNEDSLAVSLTPLESWDWRKVSMDDWRLGRREMEGEGESSLRSPSTASRLWPEVGIITELSLMGSRPSWKV